METEYSFQGSDKLSSRHVVESLVTVLGRKLTAYVGGVRDVREVDRWLAGDRLNADRENRLRLTLRVVDILLQKEPPEIVRAWIIGLNPELGDRVPLRLLREESVDVIADDVLAAARAMAVFG